MALWPVSGSSSGRAWTPTSPEAATSGWPGCACSCCRCFFLFAFAVGEGLSALLGHPDGTGTEVSGSDILLTTVPALIVFSLPVIVAAAAAHRAERQGNRRGWIPAGILITIALAFAVLNLVPMGR